MTKSTLTYYQCDEPPVRQEYKRVIQPGTVVATYKNSPWPSDKKYWEVAKKTSDLDKSFHEPPPYSENYWEWIRTRTELCDGHLLEVGSHLGRTTGLLARRWRQITVCGITDLNVSIAQGQCENFAGTKDIDITWHYSKELLPHTGAYDIIKIEYPLHRVDWNHLATLGKVGTQVFFCVQQGEFSRVNEHMKNYLQYTHVDNIRHDGPGTNRLSLALYSINNNGDHNYDTN